MSCLLKSTHCEINIPPTFPHVLKTYVKAAIRTQPTDLLRWTVAYFTALAKSEIPPVKTRLEYPPFHHPSKITPGFLKCLRMQYGRQEKVALVRLLDTWRAMVFPQEYLYHIFKIGQWLEHQPVCTFEKFLAIACGFLGNNLLETMIKVCEVLTDEPDGGSAMIPLQTFMRLYAYLAQLSCPGVKPLEQKICERPEPHFCFCNKDLVLICPQNITSGDASCIELAESVKKSTPSSSSSISYFQECCCLSEDFEQEQSGTGEMCDRIRIRKSESMTESSVDSSRLQIIRYEDFDKNYLDYYEDVEEYPMCTVSFNDESGNSQTSDMTRASAEQHVDTSSSSSSSSSNAKLETDESCQCLDEAEFQLLEGFRQKMQKQYPEPYYAPNVPGIGLSIPKEHVDSVGKWLRSCAQLQQCYIGPRNITHFLCPPLYLCEQNDN